MALVYKDQGTSGTQWSVLSNNLSIAHIRKNVLVGADARWSWISTWAIERRIEQWQLEL